MTNKPSGATDVKRQPSHLPPPSLIINPRVVREHPDRQIGMLKRSVSALSSTAPILIDEDGNVLAAHSRLRTALETGVEPVPCICVSDLSEKAGAVADNRPGDESEFDRDLLTPIVGELGRMNFDVELTDFASSAGGATPMPLSGIAFDATTAERAADMEARP